MNFLDTLQEARSPHNQIIIGLGNGWVASQSQRVRAIETVLDATAQKHGVDPGYLRYSLLTPEGKRPLHRLGLTDVWIMVFLWEELGSPRPTAFTIPETEKALEAAVRDLDAWAGSTLRDAVGRSLMQAVKSKTTDMQQTLLDMEDRRFNPNSIQAYILSRFYEAASKRPQWFANPALLRALRGGWSRPV